MTLINVPYQFCQPKIVAKLVAWKLLLDLKHKKSLVFSLFLSLFLFLYWSKQTDTSSCPMTHLRIQSEKTFFTLVIVFKTITVFKVKWDLILLFHGYSYVSDSKRFPRSSPCGQLLPSIDQGTVYLRD